MISRLLPVLLVASALCSCSTSSTTTTTEDSTTVADATVLPDPTRTFCNWLELGVREAAGDKAKYLTTIYLGEEVTLTADSTMIGENLWNKITLSDGTSGWVRADFLAKKKRPAGILTTTKIYKRPDIATLTDHEFTATDFVAADKTVNGWVHVRAKPLGEKWFREGYVQESSLVFEDKETKFASLYKRARESNDEKVYNAILTQLDEYRGISQLYAQVFEVDDESGDGYDEAEEAEPMALPEGPPYELSDIPDLDNRDGEGKIINIFGTPDYWYVYNGQRYRLEETQAEVIVQTALFWHCTEAYLNTLPVSDKVISGIPTDGYVPE
jgi:hypothetical protein